jgi:hypothetical protein
MDELFRFTVARPADRKSAPTLSLDQESRFLIELSTENSSWPAMLEVAQAYLVGLNALTHITDLPLYPDFVEFLGKLQTEPPPYGVDSLTNLAGGLLSATNQPTLATVRQRLIDKFVALYIAPNRDRPSLIEIADLLRIVALLQRIAARDTTLEATDSVPKALSITFALPAFFKVPEGRVRPVGIADLLVVKQHIARYELGEIARMRTS